MKKHILIVDDDASMLKAMAAYLNKRAYEVTACQEYSKASTLLKESWIDLALIDLRLDSCSGLELVRQIKQQDLITKSIVMTGHASVETAIQSIKEGAFHYLTKPFNLVDLLHLVEKALNYSKVEGENQLLKKQIKPDRPFQKLFANSKVMQGLSELVERVAVTDSTVLILGESGTGKELLAHAIHDQSLRNKGPMLPVNCAAIPNELLESEMFGHVKGAFTGAHLNRRGRFEMASGGTLFLDEVGDMPPQLQVKLLRTLQEKSIEPLGSAHSLEVDVRLIAATNRNLEEAVKRGSFREDLYYRLNVIPIRIPPLRERQEDIPFLIDFFLRKFSQNYGQAPLKLNDEAKQAFLRYSWPGNVRELENCLERLMILYPGQLVTLNELPFSNLSLTSSSQKKVMDIPLPEEGVSLKNLVDRFENEMILKALERTSGNKNKAASLLKLNRTTLVEKIKKRQLEKSPQFFFKS